MEQQDFINGLGKWRLYLWLSRFYFEIEYPTCAYLILLRWLEILASVKIGMSYVLAMGNDRDGGHYGDYE